MRPSISSIFAAARMRSACDAEPERRAARRYSAISASVNPTACASLIARRNRTVSSS
jgi:cytidylate kinase